MLSAYFSFGENYLFLKEIIRSVYSEQSLVWIVTVGNTWEKISYLSRVLSTNQLETTTFRKQNKRLHNCFRISKCQSKVVSCTIVESCQLFQKTKMYLWNYSDNISVHISQASRPFNLILTHLGPACSNFPVEIPAATKRHSCHTFKTQFK